MDREGTHEGKGRSSCLHSVTLVISEWIEMRVGRRPLIGCSFQVAEFKHKSKYGYQGKC